MEPPPEPGARYERAARQVDAALANLDGPAEAPDDSKGAP